MEKRSSRIGTIPSKQLDVKNQLCLDVYCGVQPRPFAIDFDAVSSTATRFGFASAGL